MTDIPYACCSRCGQPLPRELLHPFKKHKPPESLKLFCPDCIVGLVDELEEKHQKMALMPLAREKDFR